MTSSGPSRSRSRWRPIRIVAGFLTLGGGIVMLVTPGPGLLTMAGGLVILSTEYRWAKRMLGWVREQIRRRTGKRLD